MIFLKEQNFKSLFFYYFKKFFVIFLLIVFVTVSFVYYFFTKNLYEELKNNDKQIQSQTVRIFENVTSECSNVYNAVISNNNLKKFIYTDLTTLEKKDYYDSFETVRNLLSSNLMASTYVKNIVVISEKNNVLVSANTLFLKSYSEYKNSKWFETFKKSKKEVYATSENAKDIDDNTTSEYMLLCKNINTSYDVGYVFFVISIDSVRNETGKFLTENDEFYLFDKNILITSEKVSENIDINRLENLYEQKEKIAKYNVFSAEIAPYSYKMVLLSENKKYIKLFTNTIIIFFVTILLSVLLIYWISYTLAKNTMEPISDIIKILEDPKNVNLTLKLHNAPEMQFITKNILKSLDNNAQYKEQLEKKLTELNDALEITLRSQIQPHFLFNTLETIQAVTYELTNTKNTAYKMLEMLSKLLKISFRNDNKFVSVKEEIEHISNYLNIQKIRYDELFEIQWDIDENCLEFFTLKLILQPIVENAIYHGIKQCKHFCYIKISVKESENHIIFSVENNGKMIEKEELKQLNEILEEKILPSNSHIGLNNVNKRIKIAFGKEYGCNIDSSQEKTTVTIIIPKTKL